MTTLRKLREESFAAEATPITSQGTNVTNSAGITNKDGTGAEPPARPKKVKDDPLPPVMKQPMSFKELRNQSKN